MITLWATFYLGHLWDFSPVKWWGLPYMLTSFVLVFVEILSYVGIGVFIESYLRHRSQRANSR